MDNAAFIITKTGRPISCRIIDRSLGGARLLVDSILGIPHEFRLIVQKTGETLSASVAWRSPQQIGVAFANPGVLELAPATARPAVEITLDRYASENQGEGLFSDTGLDI